MSNSLALATVTAVLERLLQQALDLGLPGATAAAGRPRSDGDLSPGVVIFLSSVQPSAALRNDDLPTRSADGTVRCRPETALELDYQLICYGDPDQLEPERILGIVASTLSANPIITGTQIGAVLAAAADPSAPTHEFLVGSDLVAQRDPVRLTPRSVSPENWSNFWTGAQAPWTPTLAYRASPALIEAEVEVSPAIPVRGRSVRALPVEPIRIVAAGGAVVPLTADGLLVIVGENLRGELTSVRIGDEELPVAPTGTSQITVPLSDLAGPLTAGRNPVVVVNQVMLGQPPEPHRAAVSHPVDVVIHATIASASIGAGAVVLVTDLALRAGATVALNLIAPASGDLVQRLAGRAADPAEATITVAAPGVGAGTYLVQLEIDGEPGPIGPEVVVP